MVPRKKNANNSPTPQEEAELRRQIEEVIEEAIYDPPCCINCGSSNTMGDDDGYITCSDCGCGWSLLEDYNLPTDLL